MVMMKFVSVCALSLALLGGATAASVSFAGPDKSSMMHNDRAGPARLERAAAVAQAHINNSEGQKNALAQAVRSKNNEQVRAILMRNGMTADDLKGVELRYGEVGAPGRPNERLAIKRVTIEGGCCPPWLRITIYF
jgi:hypothetical protein